jgi:hypothetical protein
MELGSDATLGAVRVLESPVPPLEAMMGFAVSTPE